MASVWHDFSILWTPTSKGAYFFSMDSMVDFITERQCNMPWSPFCHMKKVSDSMHDLKEDSSILN